MFKTLPELNVKIVNRQVLGNVVIDHELVHLGSFQDDFEVLVLYKIRYGKIQEVWFISPD